jgi:FkbM family methyltransferase
MADKRLLLYSQDLEDFILFCALKDIENGFYIDVGANSPWFISVTKLFYDRGWSGINIEPLEDEFLELCRYRPRDINLNIGVGDREGENEFVIYGAGTTCDTETKTALLQSAQTKRSIPIRRLSSVLLENLQDKNQAIHFCKIDVEGYEKNVLEGMDFKMFRPWIMVMEATIPGTTIPCFEKWEDLLLGNNYEFAYSHGINRYYLDSRCVMYDAIKNNFKNLDNKNKMTEFELYAVDTNTSFHSLRYNLFKYYLYFFLSKICPIDSFKWKMDKYQNRIRLRVK